MANEGFLNRWSRLKRDALAPAPAPPAERALAPVQSPPQDPPQAHETALASEGGQAAAPRPQTSSVAAEQARARHDAQATSLPSLDELSLESDYSPFMRAEVDPARRMSALKKLFSDPHFNRMDGLDVYIDDYTKPDPIPKAMLARLNQSRLLGLFEEEEKAGNESAGKDLPMAPDAGEAAAAESTAAKDPALGKLAVADPAVEDPAVEATAAEETERDLRPGSRPDSFPDVPQAT